MSDRHEDDEDDRVIYARYHTDIMRFFRNKVPSGTREEANELAARTFLRFIEKRAKGALVDKEQQPILSLGAFLRGIARNVLLEHLRDITKMSSFEEIEEQSIAELGRSFSSQVVIAEGRSAIQECSRMLPLYEQLVLECIIHQDMTYLEVAELLGVPFGTVATYYSRAREDLQALYLARGPKRPTNNDPKGPTSNGENEAAVRRAYPWYGAGTGVIDDRKLLAATTRERPQTFARLPEWYVELQVPRALPKATITELSTLARSVWQAWHVAGHPVPGV
jgi:RNA polymerase sigma factor (sigma-70 family)